MGITERQQAGGFLGKTTTVSNSMTWKPSARTKSGEMGVMTSAHLCPAVFGKGCLDRGVSRFWQTSKPNLFHLPQEVQPCLLPRPLGSSASWAWK